MNWIQRMILEEVKRYHVVKESFLSHRLNKTKEEVTEALDVLRLRGYIHRDLGSVFFVKEEPRHASNISAN
jgi:Mn-dependent DtxR family transcriptional regulator